MSDKKLKHPDSKATITVQDDVAPVFESQGWAEEVKAPKEEPASK
jgi:hypothetical protein